MIDPGDLVAACGSLPPGIAPEEFAGIVAHCAGKPARIAVDTSGEALRAAVDAGPYMIKPNVAELQGLVGAELADRFEIAEAALSLTSSIEVVLVSLGEDGGILVNPHTL